jgi:hypothetical protein
MKFTRASVFLAGFYFTLILLWFCASLFTTGDYSSSIPKIFSGIKDVHYGYIFAFAYGIIPIIGGVMGFRKAEKWGLLKSSLGKALLFLSLGLITWGYGELIWSFYNFILHQEVPYPSWADAGFMVSWPLWFTGVYHLGKATGVKFGLRKMGGKLLVVIAPIVVFIVSYYLLVVVARQGSFQLEGGPLKIFFDIAYPLMDVIILTLAVLIYGLTFKYLGGQFKLPVLIILAGFISNYIADFGFSYTTTVGTFYNGNWVDLAFATTMFLLSFGITNLDTKES